LLFALTLGVTLAHAQAARGQQPAADWHKTALSPDLATALYGGVNPADSTLGVRGARIPMYRMLPGFLSDPGLAPDESGDEPDSWSRSFVVNVGDDNPFFDPRGPGDPGGVGFLRIYSQMQLLDNGCTSVCLGLRAWAPAGVENGGVTEGPTMLAPGLGVFQDLGNNAGLHGFIGQQFRADFRGARHSATECGMALHCPVPGLVEPDTCGVYLFVQALGRYGYNSPYDGKDLDWEFVPGIHWRLSDSFWLSVGASRRGMLTWSWQF
jgi:hypothetical protein